MFYQGKHTRKKSAKQRNAKILALVVAMVLVISGAVGGTLAWLMDSTKTVRNTFTYGDINITLTETDTNEDQDNDPNTNTYPMIPGHELAKDPKVVVKADSEDNWLFVKVEEYMGDTLNGKVTVGQTEYSFKDYLSYAIADGWTALDETNHPGVYYREMQKSDQDSDPISVLAGDKVTVKDTVTKEMFNALDKDADGNAIDPAKYPVLAVTAYAVQHDAKVATAADAWAVVTGN